MACFWNYYLGPHPMCIIRGFEILTALSEREGLDFSFGLSARKLFP